LFFPQSKSFEQYILKENIQVEIFRNEVTSTNTKPNLIFDKQGDLIFCGEVATTDSGFFTKMLVVKLNSKGELVSLNKIDDFNLKDFELFPNPCHEIITINLPKELQYIIEFYDVNGRIHKKANGTGVVNLPLEDILPGTYLVRVTEEKSFQQYFKKLIKL
jgi:hypothetical protein